MTPVAELCDALRDDLDGLSDRLTARVRAEIQGYAHLPQQEHRWNVRDAAEMLLRGLAAGEGPTLAEVRIVEAAALRRAQQGVAVQDVIASFHICARAIWDELRSASLDDAALVSLAGPLWDWIRALSAVVADVSAESSAREQGEITLRRQRFVELLRSGSPVDAADLARGLGFDGTGAFACLASPAAQWMRGLIGPLNRELQRRPEVAHAALHGGYLIVVSQGEAALPAQEVARLGGGCLVGAGLSRPGLSGAAESATDAILALGRARTDRPVVHFETDWLTATLASSGERLRPLLEPAARAAADHPDLAVAIRSYAAHGSNAKSAGTELHLHANTVAYRLNRWHELTGLDPRTFEGLVRSVVALDL